MAASPSTPSRFENAAGRDWAWRIHEALVESFIASHPSPPEELLLDQSAGITYHPAWGEFFSSLLGSFAAGSSMIRA